jgi:hypothetical protein
MRIYLCTPRQTTPFRFFLALCIIPRDLHCVDVYQTERGKRGMYIMIRAKYDAETAIEVLVSM